MTKRKPTGISFTGWVEQQIRAAERSGGFDNLPGQGQPIAGLNEPRHELSWVADKLRRENLSIVAVLPPALALAKEVEDLPATLAQLRSEAAVRSAVEDLNYRIIRAYRYPQDGPPVRVMTRDVEKLVEEWHAQRAEERARRAELAAEEAAAAQLLREQSRRGVMGRLRALIERTG